MSAKIPTWKEKQALVYDFDRKVSPDKLKKYADACIAEGAMTDAIEYCLESSYKEGLEKIIEFAIKEGDFFLLNQIHRRDASIITAKHVNPALDQAKAQGKELFAQKLTNFFSPGE